MEFNLDTIIIIIKFDMAKDLPIGIIYNIYIIHKIQYCL